MRRDVNWWNLLALRPRALAFRDDCACHSLGAILATGHGDSPRIRNTRSALRWYLRAALRGHSESQYDLAWMLLLGEGTTVDREAALRWFARAAEGGYCEAMRVLADAYSTGLHQVPTDARLAAYWSKRLAKHLAESPDDLRAYERAGERRGED